MWEDVIKTIFRRTRYRRPTLVITGLIVWCCIIIPVLLTYIAEGNKGNAYFEYDTNKGVEDKLLVSMDLLSVDPNARNANLLVQIDPQGCYLNEERLLSKNISVNLRFKQVQLKEGTSLEPFTVTVPFLIGTLRRYPIDQYEGYFPIGITTGNGAGRVSIPFKIQLDGISQLFKIRFSVNSAGDIFPPGIYNGLPLGPRSYVIEVTLTRPPTTLMICTFVALLMWALAIALANVAWDCIIYRREILPPILSIGVSMLFALPALRNSQPGVPAMGCLLDMAGFFWALVLIAISSSALIFRWVLSWQPASWKQNA